MKVTKTVRDVIIERLSIVLNNDTLLFTPEQVEAIMIATEPNRSGGTSTKVNAEGDVYCNYFERYLPESEFKVSPKGKYPPMSVNGTKLRQKSLTLDKQMNKEISEAFLKGITIKKDEIVKKYDDLKSNLTTGDKHA